VRGPQVGRALGRRVTNKGESGFGKASDRVTAQGPLHGSVVSPLIRRTHSSQEVRPPQVNQCWVCARMSLGRSRRGLSRSLEVSARSLEVSARSRRGLSRSLEVSRGLGEVSRGLSRSRRGLSRSLEVSARSRDLRRQTSVQRSCGGMRSDPDTRGPRNHIFSLKITRTNRSRVLGIPSS